MDTLYDEKTEKRDHRLSYAGGCFDPDRLQRKEKRRDRIRNSPEYAAESDFSGVLDVSGDWKSAFEKVLLKECGVKPDHYENLGNGIYEVYVEKDGKVIPYAILDSETGEYHG
ncbi:MAG: hypothetical protein V8S22_08500 [Lachnospiraceae bacterium]